MEITLYENFKDSDFDKVRPKDIIVYGDNYLVVDRIDYKEKVIHGQIASPIGVNCVGLDQIVKKESEKML